MFFAVLYSIYGYLYAIVGISCRSWHYFLETIIYDVDIRYVQ